MKHFLLLFLVALGFSASTYGQIPCETLPGEGLRPSALSLSSDFAPGPLEADTVVSFQYKTRLNTAISVQEIVTTVDDAVSGLTGDLGTLIYDAIGGDPTFATILALIGISDAQDVQDLLDGIIAEAGLDSFQVFLGIEDSTLDDNIVVEVIFDSLKFNDGSVRLEMLSAPGSVYTVSPLTSNLGPLPVAYVADTTDTAAVHTGCLDLRFLADSTGFGILDYTPNFNGFVKFIEFPAQLNDALDDLLGFTLPVGTALRITDLPDLLLTTPISIALPVPATFPPPLGGLTITITLDWPNQEIDVSTGNVALDLALGAFLPIDLADLGLDVNALLGDLLVLPTGEMVAEVNFIEQTTARADALGEQLGIQLYPNPVGPATVVAYTLPQAATVGVEVLNATGQRVYQASNAQRAGFHSHNLGELAGMPAGVYALRLTVNGHSFTHNLLVP